MKHITRFALFTGALLGAASPAAAQDPQWIRDIQSQVESSVAAAAQAVAAQFGQADRARAKAERERAKAQRERDAFRGPEYTEPFTKTVRLGQRGTLDLTTINGDVTITGGGGDDVKIDATKRVRGTNEPDGRALLKQLDVLVNERPGLLEVRAQFPRRTNFPFITVDYSVAVPAGTSLTIRTVSGDVNVSGVKGDISTNTVSGNIQLRGSRSRAIDMESVSGDMHLDALDSDRVQLRTVSGNIDFAGKLTRSGRYDMQSHSGDIHIAASDSPGFDIEASTFNGDISSEYPVTLRSGAGNSLVSRGGPGRSIRGSFGDASAILTLRSFSGDISINKK